MHEEMNIINTVSANVQRHNGLKVTYTDAVYRPFRIVRWKSKKLQVRSIGFTVFTINCTAIINHFLGLIKTKVN
jgi:hypothetical protein